MSYIKLHSVDLVLTTSHLVIFLSYPSTHPVWRQSVSPACIVLDKSAVAYDLLNVGKGPAKIISHKHSSCVMR